MSRPNTPVTTQGISNAIAVCAGYLHSCALVASGDVKCWGGNSNGQLGDGTTTQHTTPVSVLSGVAAISCGYEHTCALLANGQVQCWGYNQYGQIGDGTTTQRNSPTTATGF